MGRRRSLDYDANEISSPRWARLRQSRILQHVYLHQRIALRNLSGLISQIRADYVFSHSMEVIYGLGEFFCNRECNRLFGWKFRFLHVLHENDVSVTLYGHRKQLRFHSLWPNVGTFPSFYPAHAPLTIEYHSTFANEKALKKNSLSHGWQLRPERYTFSVYEAKDIQKRQLRVSERRPRKRGLLHS